MCPVSQLNSIWEQYDIILYNTKNTLNTIQILVSVQKKNCEILDFISTLMSKTIFSLFKYNIIREHTTCTSSLYTH